MDVFFVLVILFLFFASLRFIFTSGRLPPGPLCFPFVGSVLFLRRLRRKRTHIALLEAAKKYGNVFSFKMGSQLIVALNGYDAINEALVKNADVFSDRPNHLPALKNIMKDGGGILFQSYNEKWKALRRFTLHTLRDFGVGKTSIEEKVIIEIEAAASIFKETNGEPMDISPILQKMVGNVIYGIIFGNRYDFGDPDFEMIRRMCDTVVGGQGLANPANFFPRWITKLIARKANEEIQTRIDIIRDIKQYIFKQIQEHEDTFDEHNIRDFLDLYIQVTRDTELSEGDAFITKSNMLRIILELFIVGVETTATALSWGFLFMSEHPDIQQKCQQEIEDNLGDKLITYSDRKKLTYVTATVREILRLSNASPLGAPHCTSKDIVFMGYHIPKRTVIMNNIYSATLDPSHWNDPYKFNPDRFIDSSGSLIEKDALIPFSVGPRVCLGEPLAKLEIFLVLTNLLQRFSFQKVDKTISYSMKPKPNQVTNAPLAYKLRIIDR